MRLAVLLASCLLAGCVPPAVVSEQSGPVQAEPQAAQEQDDMQARIEPREMRPPPAVSPKPGPTEVERALTYYEDLKKLAHSQLAREHESARAAFSRTKSDFDRLRLAMVLSLPNTPVSDDQRAVDLLDPIARSPDSSLRGLASLMQGQLVERARLEGSMQTLQRNVDGLQQKLDALMSLERSMVDREQGNPAKKR